MWEPPLAARKTKCEVRRRGVLGERWGKVALGERSSVSFQMQRKGADQAGFLERGGGREYAALVAELWPPAAATAPPGSSAWWLRSRAQHVLLERSRGPGSGAPLLSPSASRHLYPPSPVLQRYNLFSSVTGVVGHQEGLTTYLLVRVQGNTTSLICPTKGLICKRWK